MRTPLKRPRVAFIARRFGAHFGGAEAYAEHLLNELRRTFEIHVFCQEWSSDAPLSYTLVPRTNGFPRWLNLLDFTRRCEPLVRDFDVVHSHENSWLGHVQGIHVMPVRYSRLHARGGWSRRLSTWTSPRWLAYLALEAWRYRDARGRVLVAVSPLIQEQIRTAYGSRTANIVVIPPGVPIPKKYPSRTQACSALGLSPDRRYALLVGNDPIRKGFKTLLRALPALDESVDLIVVGGKGNTASDVRQLAAKAGRPERVHIWPAQRDLCLHYAAADICAFPTSGDAFGLVPLEAMSYGLPVILSSHRYCGLAKYVQDGANALVLGDPDDGQALAHAINRLVTDAQLYAHLSNNGRQLAVEMGWDRVAACYADLYREAIPQVNLSPAIAET